MITQGLRSTPKQIQEKLEQLEGVGVYTKGKLTPRLVADWRLRIKEQLDILNIRHDGNHTNEQVDFETAHSIYNAMFHFMKTGRKRILPGWFLDMVRALLEERRKNYVPITVDTFKQLSIRVARHLDKQNFKAGKVVQEEDKWVTQVNHCSRSTLQNMLHNMGYRDRGVSKSDPLPFKHDKMGEIFISKLISLKRKYRVPPELIINFDETSVEMVASGKSTYELPNVKDVRLIGATDKRTLTYSPVVNSNGDIIMSQLIVPGQSEENESEEPYWREPEHMRRHTLLMHTSGGKKTWQNQRTFRKLITAIATYVDSWIANRGMGARAGILLLDCAGAHTSRGAMEILKEFPQIQPLFIPPKMTSVLQPLDLSFFAPFKMLLKSSVAKFMLSCGDTLATLPAAKKPEYL
jgi:hypothetical protein